MNMAEKRTKSVDKDSSSEEDEEGLKAGKRMKWSDEENIYLAHGVKKLGRGNWAEILKKYNKYFDKERTRQDLNRKYRDLEKNKTFLDSLEKKAELIEDTDTVDVLKFKYGRWSEEEIIYLVHGVEKLGRDNWLEIIKKYKKYFNKDRRSKDLLCKYQLLEKNKNVLESFKKKAELIKEIDLEEENLKCVKWSEEETIYLVHGVKTVGKGNWAEILSRYKNYFDKVRTRHDLIGKYHNLETNKNVLESFEKKAELIKEDDLKDVMDKRLKYVKWSEKETIYLVHAVSIMGKGKWHELFLKYKKYFNNGRNSQDLRNRYRRLGKNNKLEFYVIKPELLEEMKQ